MSIASFIVLSIALGINAFVYFRLSASHSSQALSRWLLAVLVLAIVHVALMALGLSLGRMLRPTSPDDPMRYSDVCSYIFLGFTLVVIVKKIAPFMRRTRRIEVRLFPMGTADFQWGSTLAASLATGIDVFLIGLGAGMVDYPAGSVHRFVWPMLLLLVLGGMLGTMFGRRAVAVRPRRWMLVAAVLMLGVAVAAVVNNAK